ncbi:MAG TPA: hypothetical protein VMB71_02555 [Acetobacteraceae bacterium]|nr:hypothetical protein [Acetobacteraceae bacterium]
MPFARRLSLTRRRALPVLAATTRHRGEPAQEEEAATANAGRYPDDFAGAPGQTAARAATAWPRVTP